MQMDGRAAPETVCREDSEAESAKFDRVMADECGSENAR